MALVRYVRPSMLQQFNALQDQLNQLMGTSPDDNNHSQIETADWHPAVDLKEEADRYVLLADLPGVDPKDIHVEFHNDTLSLKGERHAEKKSESEKYTRFERFSGSFYRQFSFPDNVNGDAISAKTNHGVLEITIPKQEVAQKRQIKVQS